MSRRRILEGGKKEEILEVSFSLFLKYGYEGTSVRMILNEVGGEVGMFYHYFHSKQELFDNVFEGFMKKQSEKISQILSFESDFTTPHEKIGQILSCYIISMEEYKRLADGTMHWSIVSALHEATVLSMLPGVKNFVTVLCGKDKWNHDDEMEWTAVFLLKGISGILHEEHFLNLKQEEQLEIMISLICRTLSISESLFEQRGQEVFL